MNLVVGVVKMLKIHFVLLVIGITACSPAPVAQVSNLLKYPVVESAMPDKMMIAIKNVELLAKEERYPPDGIPPQANRDIGFADVFVHLENSQETIIKLKIQKIEIRNASDSKLQDFSFVPQTVELKPLENSELVFHLSNKTGYVGQDKVKAVLAYQVKNQVRVIESEAVTVNNN
ncbi:MAG: hypothetical protein ACK5QJ_14660 [Microcystis sp.]|uniref:hypothetical protein n=1 Tax=Microcystis TaxID=1125 RepID=UPI001056FA20|nr:MULTISPECIES: hypothetical protein [Microcystis]MCA2720088.1 hypothetical protein [Microcystis sp. M169S2]MCZ8162634.1 hypothetical protein [Microcystis sp. LE19-196.1B]MCZ8274829.1 hypothetical protein [Microcystis sp. LE19-4.1E]WNF16115.1 hypothetical protein RKE53_06935 [Microcystis aeruginosa NRERC-214]